MSRICTAAWYEIESAAAAGADLLVLAGDCVRPFQQCVRVKTTLAYGKLRLPYRILGARRMCMLHDWLVAQQLPRLAGEIDVIHAWPLGALKTIQTAKRLGIPVALERCNAHTRFAYEVVEKECQKLGIRMPEGHEHSFNSATLAREEQEYQLAHHLLCPSDFVVNTFVKRGFPASKLIRHQYGFDPKIFYPCPSMRNPLTGLRALFVGGCAPRKGLHFALDAWLRSPASEEGRFIIVGDFIPKYREILARQLAHPSVRILGHRNDVADQMRRSDILVLPSIEEGSALVTSEARGCGAVLLVSEAAGAICRHRENALVHRAGDVTTLTHHFTTLHRDRDLLRRLREASLRTISQLTWEAAGRRLVAAYQRALTSNFQAGERSATDTTYKSVIDSPERHAPEKQPRTLTKRS
jgi:glycosyltransferase involved in cell wall biosynthesis